MESAALCSLFSSNRNHVMKPVKLIRNPLENCRGTFAWNIVKRTFKAGKLPTTDYWQSVTICHG